MQSNLKYNINILFVRIRIISFLNIDFCFGLVNDRQTSHCKVLIARYTVHLRTLVITLGGENQPLYVYDS